MEEEANRKAPPAISLRPFQLSDVDDVMEWMSDALVGRHTSWETVTTREEALEYMRTTVLPHPWYRAVCVDGKPVGFIAVRPRSGVRRCGAEISGSLSRKYWGRGIPTVVLRMATAAVFHDWPRLERLDALVVVENRASSRVLEKAGFTMEGVHEKYAIIGGRLQNVARYSLLRVKSKL
ncbi:hypothetical protein Taro_052340 [Colocasia esculenta]|uniref:N-acetyltransferase domain-containing protein n=1 Tax=Colocasia esculenta TaxID=4460 RepID=A0A843XI71_COLES|nr:hypothetical protein [Colocasia esculenta]